MSSEDLIVRQYRNRIRKRVLSTLLVGLILCVLVILDIQIGSSSIVLKDLIEAVLEGPEGGSSASFIVWEIRLPMTFTCLFVGASRSLAGLVVVIQVTDRIDIFKSFRIKNLCHVLREGVVSHVP